MGKPVNAPLIANIRKAMAMSGFDDVSHVGIIGRDGYDEIRIDSPKAYAAAIADASIVLNTLRFADKGVTGVYGKAIIGGVKAKKANSVTRLGILAHIPKK